jgi:hypothetical protein
MGGVAAMSRYHLQARLFVGPLAKPRRDDWRDCATNDPEAAEGWARQAWDDGFTVWVYNHGRKDPLPFASDWHLIGLARPGGDFAAISAAFAAAKAPPGRQRRGWSAGDR